MTNTELGDATLAVVALARRCPDSWIAVSDALNRLIAEGTSLRVLVAVIDAQLHPIGLPLAFEGNLMAELPDLTAGYTVIDATSDRYPADLDVVDGRPLLLYVKGTLPDIQRSSLAIVGTRKPSRAAVDAAFEIAAEVARAGHPVVSGLAEGVDTAAHRGALSVDGVTVAVMGTGIDQIFPRQNAELADQIAQTGALVTQFAPGQGPSKTTFPARNALIAGLADASLLVELNERSGTRIEAERTLEQGKPVWLWAPIMRSAAWAHTFAERDGVSFVESIAQILHGLDQLEQK
jgi:DNA processing protein